METALNPHASLQQVFASQKKQALALRNSDAGQRIDKIRRLRNALVAHEDALVAAGMADSGKPAAEVLLGEVTPVLLEMRDAIRNLKKWMRPQPVATSLMLPGARSEVRAEPRGVCLIMAPWNFPVALSLGPLVSALAAGNAAMLKPSELTPHLSAVIADIVRAALASEDAHVCTGDIDIAEALLKLPFDHIFFTGSPQIGKRVMAAAAEHLSSVTLELGGKCPVIILPDADIDDAVSKIVAGKWLNCGQICLAPDHIHVHQAVYPLLLERLQARLRETYGDVAQSPDYARIINARHHARLGGLIDDARRQGAVIHGGVSDASEHLLGPTLLTGCHDGMRIMHEEIFGPLLPVLPWQDLAEPIAAVNAREKPLALYVFGRQEAAIEQVLRETSAGASCINQIALHFVHQGLPFGGVNHSGIGKSKGRWGFLAFSNERAVLHGRFLPANPIRAPYTPRTLKLARLLLAALTRG